MTKCYYKNIYNEDSALNTTKKKNNNAEIESHKKAVFWNSYKILF